ncbi:MAG: tetratricopeptide repeat protein [Planctomycetota bacterium]
MMVKNKSTDNRQQRSATASILRWRLLAFSLLLLCSPAPLRASSLIQDDSAAPANLPNQRQQLREMIIDGRAQPALDRIQSLRSNHPDDSGLALLEGEAYYALELFGKAVQAFQVGLELEPGKKGQLFNLGRALQDLGRDEEALQVFERMQKRPEVSLQTSGLFGSGLSRLNLGDESAARDLFQRSLELDPTFDRARYRLALLLLTENPAQTLVMLDQILKRDPLHHGSAYNRALALRNMNQPQQAKEAMDRYSKILAGRSRIALIRERWAMTPNSIPLMMELAKTHRELGVITEALGWYSRAAMVAPSDPRPIIETVRTLLEAGKRNEAIQLVQGLQRSPIFSGTPAAREAQALLDRSSRKVPEGS